MSSNQYSISNAFLATCDWSLHLTIALGYCADTKQFLGSEEMARTSAGVALLVFVFGHMTTSVYAEGCARCRLASGWTLASRPSTAFSSDTITTISGEVVSVQEVAPDQEVVPGIYILVQVDDDQWPVRLAPLDYLSKQGVTIEPKDQVVVAGSEVELIGRSGLIATQLQHKGKTVQLRGDKGVAKWGSESDR